MRIEDQGRKWGDHDARSATSLAPTLCKFAAFLASDARHPPDFPSPLLLSLYLYKSWDAFKTKIAMHRMRQQRNLARFRRRHALPIAESVVDERASIIRLSSAPPLVPPRSFLSDLDQEDENMSKPRGTDDEDGMEDARTHMWAWFGVDSKECRNERRLP